MRHRLFPENAFIVHEEVRGMPNGVRHDHVRLALDKQHLEWDAPIPEFLLQAQTVTATLGRNNLDVHENRLALYKTRSDRLH
jgi:hypothetical protein